LMQQISERLRVIVRGVPSARPLRRLILTRWSNGRAALGTELPLRPQPAVTLRLPLIPYLKIYTMRGCSINGSGEA
jgi:hypothetical protein